MSQDELDTSTGVEEVIDLDDPEPRWPAFVAVIAVGGLYTALPDALTLGPRWLFPSAILALLVPTIVSHHTGKHRVNAIFGFAVDAVLTLGLIVSVIFLIGALPTHKQAPLELYSRLLRFGLPTFSCLLCGIGDWTPADRTSAISLVAIPAEPFSFPKRR